MSEQEIASLCDSQPRTEQATISRSVGVQAILPPGAASVDLFARYQHFAAEWLVPYVAVRAGSAPGETRGPNVGADLGVKLALAPLGHVDLSLGATRAGGLHASVGLGLDWLLVLAAALHGL